MKRTPPGWRGLTIAAAVVSLLAGAATGARAVQPPEKGPGGWPPSPSLERQPAEIPVPQDELTQQALRRDHAGLRELRAGHPAWRATIDPHTGGLDRAFGDGLPLEGLPDAEGAARGFLASHAGLFPAGMSQPGLELRWNEAASRPLGDTGARVLTMDLYKDDLPVLGAGLSLGSREGRVVLVTTRALGPVAAPSRPRLDPDEALEAVERYTGVELVLQREASLAFYPVPAQAAGRPVLRHRLVYVLQALPDGAPPYDAYVAWVDAVTGEVLVFYPEARHIGACQSDPSKARGRVVGGVRPNRADDAEVVREMPFAQVMVNGVPVGSDINGRFLWPGGTLSCTLPGTFFESHCDNCTSPPEPAVTGLPSGTVDFGTGGSSGPVPVFGNGFSTPADRSAFYHLQQTRLFMGKWDGAFFDEIEVFTNISATCNAFSSSAMLGFFPAGGGCRNTAEIRDVVSHELGHTWDRYDGNDITNGGMSEWKGDLMALTIGGDSCVGESFKVTGGPTSACSGVRDIDETAPGRTDHPLTPAICATCATLSISANNCGTASHCLGEIPGQASVHLLGNLLAGADDITGVPLPAGNPAVSAEQARWILERLLVGGGPPMQVQNPASSGFSIYDAVALMDDEDGNLANGTPHAAYYNGALAHHGLAEAVQVNDAPACAPLADPAFTATLDRDAATGLPMVRLDWAGAPGASYDVYRNLRAGDAFIPLARGLTGGPFNDVGVRTGGTYRYWVASVRRTGCAEISPGATVTSVTVGSPDLRIQNVVLTEAPGASDGDGLVEPGEQANVAVTLSEAGGAAGATGVTATLSSALPSAPIVSAGPVSFGSIAAAGSAPGAAPFKILLGPSLGCGGRAHVTLSIGANEGCWLDSADLLINSSGSCAPAASAFVEMVPGSLAVISGGGDTDGIPDNCEAATASYQVRNAGAAASGAITSTAASSHPGLTFSPPPTCSPGSLAPGATAPCSFSFSLSSAAPSGTIPFTITTTAAGQPAPSVAGATLAAEANPPVFGTQSYDFEGSFQGWTAKQFTLSTARASNGTTSAYSGSTSIPNICGRLTSPALRVHPSLPSQLSFFMYALIEPITDAWYDRANVHVIDVDTGIHTLVSPSQGQAYNAFDNPQGGLCHIAGETGWGGLLGGFGEVRFDLSPWAGKRIRIEVNYGSDEGDNREGLYVDQVTITNAAPAVTPDLQPDACTVPEVSAPAAAVPLHVTIGAGNTYQLQWQDLGAGFQYNLYAGSLGTFYNHGATPLACSGVGAGVTCAAGACSISEPAAAVAGDRYFLVTASGFGLEGTSGFASAGGERDPAQNTCTP
jgi:trimeric autotransporter adhesin